MGGSRLASEVVENYLKAIYHLSHGEEGATPQALVRHLNVSPSAVSKMLRQAEKLGFLEYTPYHSVRLTTVGQKVALEVIRHHRLLELYLMESLGFGWDRVHAEAERLEHHISNEFADRIDLLLGSPEFDPHGDPIPTRDGAVGTPVRLTLEAQLPGTQVTVRRVTDEDEDLLRYLAERGIRPGQSVVIVSREPFGGSIHLQVGDLEQRISPEAAKQVFVELASAT